MTSASDFSPWDFVVFAFMMLVSMGIGMYFAIKGDGQKSQGEYLMGGRNMPLLPVAISLLVSQQSAIMMIGIPGEMYTQGTEYYLAVIGNSLGYLFGALLFVPLLYPLKVTSAYEYLEKRYKSRSVRLLGTIIVCIGQSIYMGIASYAPCTALAAVTGYPIWAILLVTGFVATFYTSLGGMKAVVWTDLFQAFIMVAGLFSIAIQGTIKVGGISKVFDVNRQYDRLHFFNMDFDPRVRHTFWGLAIGGMFTWMGTSGNAQASVQRYCSLSTMKQAKASLAIGAIGMAFFTTLTCFNGLVMFAYYALQNCDLLEQEVVENQNQMIPYFVMEILSYPAIPGLFMSSLFSGGLSSVSSSMNALAAITWEDCLKPTWGKNMSDQKQTVILKGLVVTYGVISVVSSYAVSYLEGTVIQAATSLIGPTQGALTGIFLLGALFPFANKYGALVGGLIGMLVSMWISLGSYLTGITNRYLDLPKPNGTCDATDGSLYTSNSTTATTFLASTAAPIMTTEILSDGDTSIVNEIYSISYLWFVAVALVVCVIVGAIVSLITIPFTSEEERKVPKEYLMPIFTRIFPCFPESWLYTLDCCRDFEDPEEILRRRDEELAAESLATDREEKDIQLSVISPDIHKNGHTNGHINGQAYDKTINGHGVRNSGFSDDKHLYPGDDLTKL